MALPVINQKNRAHFTTRFRLAPLANYSLLDECNAFLASGSDLTAYWRAGVSQLNRTTGTIFLVYIYIYILDECNAFLASGSNPTA